MGTLVSRERGVSEMSKKGFYHERYVAEDGSIQKRVKLFEYEGKNYMATKDGKLIPHECAYSLIKRVFGEE